MNETSRVTAPKLWVVLARCQRAMALLVERWIGEAGLSTSDFQLLETLLHKGPLTIAEIQKKVLLATGSMTVAVDRVEKKGLVNRTATPGDRRARRLVLTEKGSQLADALYKAHAEQLETAMSALDDAEIRELYRLLKKLGLFAAEELKKAEKRKQLTSTRSDVSTSTLDCSL